jgi:hypothetical protein
MSLPLVLAACPCCVSVLRVCCPGCMSILLVRIACQCYMPLLHVYSAYPGCTVHAAWTCCMSPLHFYAAGSCCMSFLMFSAACPSCMPMLHVLAACPRCISKVHVQAASMPPLHAACPCNVGILHVQAVFRCRMYNHIIHSRL